MKPSTSKTILSKGEGEAIPAIPSTRCRCEDTRREDSNEQCDFCTQQAKLENILQLLSFDNINFHFSILPEEEYLGINLYL